MEKQELWGSPASIARGEESLSSIQILRFDKKDFIAFTRCGGMFIVDIL